MIYTSVSNEHIKDIKKLNQKKYRDLNNKFIVEGEHLVLEALKNNLIEEVLVLEGNNYNFDVKTNYVTLNVLKYITELDNPAKIIGICKKKNDIIKGNKILILDEIQDPGNLGTIIRSSVAFNIDTIILSRTGVDLYNSKVIRATQGMIFNINIVTGNLKEEVKKLKENNYKILTTRVDNGKLVSTVEKNNKFAIIIGNEGQGVSKELQDLSDEFIYIKMNKKCESLNAGVAASIILYELSR